MKQEEPVLRRETITKEIQRSAINSKELFGESRQLAIAHKGVIYYLRITGNDKLILTK